MLLGQIHRVLFPSTRGSPSITLFFDTNVRAYTTVKVHRLTDTSARLKSTKYNLDLMEITVLNLSDFPIEKSVVFFFPGMFSAGCQTLKSLVASKDINILITLVKNCFRKPLQK